MKLSEYQAVFARKISVLIQVAYELGYTVTLGDGNVDSKVGHKENSNHYRRLAQDLNLFKDGVYLTKTEDHLVLGEIWEKMGGCWGGRFGDGNHYSLEWNGFK